MKLLQAVFIFLSLVLVLCVVAVQQQDSPEMMLVGTWEEVAWEYEKTNARPDGYQTLDEAQKDEICTNLFRHETEVWDFGPNKDLTLLKDGLPVESLKWNVKGRGNILEIVHQDRRIEDFHMQQIDHENLVMHFSFDLQVKGIMKLTFKRMTGEQYAQKI